MKIPYYPGCTLSTNAKDLEDCARFAAEILGFSMEELSDWNCCGASFPLNEKNIMGLAGPANVLIDIKSDCEKVGLADKAVTLCAVCYNVLKRTNHAFKKDGTKLTAINAMLGKDYKADADVVHYLELLRDDIGFDKVKESVEKPLKGLKVAPYYGCFMLRPHDEIDLDDPYAPTIFEGLLKSLGCEVVEFSHKIECCGSYSAMRTPENATKCSFDVIGSAEAAGADIIATTCPLCHFNLDEKQGIMKESDSTINEIPIVYFTQLMAISFGKNASEVGFEHSSINPLPLLEEKGLT